jgi:hypothetical protein
MSTWYRTILTSDNAEKFDEIFDNYESDLLKALDNYWEESEKYERGAMYREPGVYHFYHPWQLFDEIIILSAQHPDMKFFAGIRCEADMFGVLQMVEFINGKGMILKETELWDYNFNPVPGVDFKDVWTGFAKSRIGLGIMG